MIRLLIRSSLGRMGENALNWVGEHPFAVTAVLLAWLGLVVAGRLQLWRIERKTTALVLEMSRDLIAGKSHITAGGLYQRIYPAWSRSLPLWGWFIPHRLDLWPVRVCPETVQQKLDFSPPWIREVLHQHGIKLGADEDGEDVEESSITALGCGGPGDRADAGPKRG